MFTLDRKNPKVTSPGYIGKLRSNYLGTRFYIYDKGANPET